MTLAPAVAVWGIGLSGVVTDFLPLVAIGLLVSLVVAYVGRALWEMRPDPVTSSSPTSCSGAGCGAGTWKGVSATPAPCSGSTPGPSSNGATSWTPRRELKALKKLVIALEARDLYSHGHSRRVARYSTMIAKRLGVPAAEVARIRLAATLHDVGKLVVPPAVLNKPGRLTEVELGVVERHAPVGADMVSPIGDGELTRIVAHHHERLDGTGYPSQLSGSEIPLGARIIAVADTFDALTSARVYKPAKRHRDVFRILGEEMGTQLDPVAVQAFSRSYSGFRGIAAWSIVSGAPQRLLLPLAGQAPVAGGALSAKTLATLSAAAAIGGLGSGSSPTDPPRDTGASPAAVPAIAAFGASAGGVPFPDGRGAELRSRGHGQGGNASDGVPVGGAREGGGKGDEPSGGGPGPGDQPGPGDGPGTPPDPGNLPGPDAPAIPANPGRAIGRQLHQLGGQAGRPQSVQPPGPPQQLGGAARGVARATRASSPRASAAPPARVRRGHR